MHARRVRRPRGSFPLGVPRTSRRASSLSHDRAARAAESLQIKSPSSRAGRGCRTLKGSHSWRRPRVELARAVHPTMHAVTIATISYLAIATYGAVEP
eukprot:tig00000455_g1010.t1